MSLHSIILPQRPAFSLFHTPSLLVVSTYQLESAEERAGALHLLSPDLTQNDVIPTSSGVFRFSFLSTDRIVSALTNGSLSIGNIPDKKIVCDVPVSDVMLLDVSLSGTNAVTSDNSGHLFEVDLDTQTVVSQWKAHQLPYTGEGCEVWSCSHLSPSLCVSGAEDATLCVWDLKSQTKVGQSKVFGSGVVFTAPRGDDYILTGSYDEHVRLFDRRNLKNIVTETKLCGGVWSIEQLGDGRCVAACMYGGWSLLDYKLQQIKGDEDAGSQLLYGATLGGETLAFVTFNNYTVSTVSI